MVITVPCAWVLKLLVITRSITRSNYSVYGGRYDWLAQSISWFESRPRLSDIIGWESTWAPRCVSASASVCQGQRSTLSRAESRCASSHNHGRAWNSSHILRISHPPRPVLGWLAGRCSRPAWKPMSLSRAFDAKPE